jgi:hypothetical protein
MVSTDVNAFMCIMFEEARLERVPPSWRPSAPLVRGHPPDRAHQFDGYKRQLQDLYLAIWLSTLALDGGDPPPHGVIEALSQFPSAVF